MTNQNVINFLNQVRKILLDDKSWLKSTIQPINEAFDMAISALQEQEEKHSTEELKQEVKNLKESSLTPLDTISRQAAIDLCDWYDNPSMHDDLEKLPSVQPKPSEITDEQAILHLQSTGWMQNHDREMYESGLREQLADGWIPDYECSECGSRGWKYADNTMNFCPNCGADMREEQDE